MNKISVIIVNYNTAELVKFCIASVLEWTTDIDFEIIVVDNDSAEREIVDIITLFPKIKFIQSNKNIGFGRACNKAAETASGEYFLFLNPDTQFKNNVLKYFLDFWLNHPDLNIGCIGTAMLDEHSQTTHSAGKFPDRVEYLKAKVLSLLQRLSFKSYSNKDAITTTTGAYQKVDYITGADLFISRENFQQVNGFDPAFFLYFEETDLQFRLTVNGRFSFLINGPMILHRQGGSLRNQNIKMRVLYFNGMLTYFKKHSSPLHFNFFRFCWFLLDLPTVIQKLFLIRKSK
ncbi:MAG: glycosyltransferase family 2 protein [Chitinophagaceae bacterium]|jgi:hypothetical protein